ncbi:MAG TPA: CPBP family intramembrane glutamic endopeptidase [Terracidiphilus sp.]|nr:CPBP family intramembrane glutamic endopeptidase [Terracidiphilus sp.]
MSAGTASATKGIAALPNPEDAPQPESPAGQSLANIAAAQPIAPWWHTVLLVAGIVLISFAGAKEFTGPHTPRVDRMGTYAITAVTELTMLAWIWFGLRLKRVRFRSLIGDLESGVRGLAIDLGVAGIFWTGSLFVLASLGIMWQVADAVAHHRAFAPNGQPDATQQHTIHTLLRLAPATASEIAAWILVCALAGFAEEIVFRGYLQRQFTAWGRGALWCGVVFSAILFGMAHGYQGARNMVLLSVFGALFSLLAIFRRSLRAGMIAHAWQDLIAGLGLALLHSRHFI